MTGALALDPPGRRAPEPPAADILVLVCNEAHDLQWIGSWLTANRTAAPAFSGLYDCAQ